MPSSHRHKKHDRSSGIDEKMTDQKEWQQTGPPSDDQCQRKRERQEYQRSPKGMDSGNRTSAVTAAHCGRGWKNSLLPIITSPKNQLPSIGLGRKPNMPVTQKRPMARNKSFRIVSLLKLKKSRKREPSRFRRPLSRTTQTILVKIITNGQKDAPIIQGSSISRIENKA